MNYQILIAIIASISFASAAVPPAPASKVVLPSCAIRCGGCHFSLKPGQYGACPPSSRDQCTEEIVSGKCQYNPTTKTCQFSRPQDYLFCVNQVSDGPLTKCEVFNGGCQKKMLPGQTGAMPPQPYFKCAEANIAGKCYWNNVGKKCMFTNQAAYDTCKATAK